MVLSLLVTFNCVDLTDLVEFALFTGMRRGEVRGLTWDRVNRARGQRGATLQEVKDLLGPRARSP